MLLAPFLVAFFLIRYLQKSLVSDHGISLSVKPLRGFLLIGIGLLGAEVAFNAEYITKWIWHLILIAIALFMYKTDDLKHSRTLLIGVLPFIAISLVNDILQAVDRNLYNTWKGYMEAGILFSLILLVIMWVNNNKQQKALEKERLKRQFEEQQNKIIAARKNELEMMVSERTAELISQKEDLEKALAELSATQHQLIQQEKLASLGELTAGIAHEIQNPLNFVNNFSEVSAELIDELQEEQRKDFRNLGNETEILEMLKENLAKIKHHGKRADAIVKGMLQHSRSSNGKIEPVDINALADEYLRLSYHGLRAKDKSFNAIMQTDFDSSVGKVNVLPQDLGRVILNLLTNAFYSVNQKRKHSENLYEPTVSVQTKKYKNKILIKIRDNGLGIPPKALDKIYQPFFTTKPAGEGTGLGLSLSYDIITKGHQGEMKVSTREGEYAEFNIFIPLNLS
ncbi:histidine kinase [Flavihumibacter sp. R14]|nr:histidine kinase [Flavihumibacter soli]